MKGIPPLSLLDSSASLDKYEYLKQLYFMYSILVLHAGLGINLKACQNTTSLATEWIMKGRKYPKGLHLTEIQQWALSKKFLSFYNNNKVFNSVL